MSVGWCNRFTARRRNDQQRLSNEPFLRLRLRQLRFGATLPFSQRRCAAFRTHSTRFGSHDSLTILSRIKVRHIR